MMRVTRRSYGTIGLAILVLLIALVSAGTVFTPRAHAESAAGDSFENAIPLTVDAQVDVNVPNYDTPTYLCFTPSINATYRFYSTRDDSTGADPYGWLYEYNGSDYVQKAYNDDSGGDSNFSITYTMTAGTTYWLRAGVYGNANAGSYTVHLERTSQVRVQSADGETVYFARPGQSQTMGVTATTDEDLTVAYQWYHFDGGGSYTPIEGATSASYTATMSDAAEEYYKVVATDRYSSGEVEFRLLDETGSVSALTKEDAIPLALDETKCAKLPHGGACWFVVTPSASGFYGFKSQGNEDSRAELYNAAGDKIAENDDGGSNNNFYIHNWLDAGQAYYLKVHGVTSSASGCLVDVTMTYEPIDIANGGTVRFDDDLYVSEGTDDRALYTVEGAGATVTPGISVKLNGNALPAEAFTISYERSIGFDDSGEELFEDAAAPFGPGRYRVWVHSNPNASYIGQLGPLWFDVVESNSPDYQIISFELADSYGDGWNGAAIRVVDTTDGSELARLTIGSGRDAEGAVPLASGHTYQFVWESGSYNSECYFTLKNGEETILEGGGSGHANGDVLLTYAAGIGPYESYDLWVADTQVDNVNAADVLVDGTISYDLETHTLTLDNCALVSDSSGDSTTALIYVDSGEGPVTIDLKGNNVIEGGPGAQYGIYAGAGVTFTGDGSLTAIGGGSTSSSTASFGIFASGDIMLDGSFTGTVVAKGGATSGNTYGISGSTVTVNGGTLVTVGGVGVDGASIGLHAGSSLNVTGGTVIAQGGSVAKGNSIGVNLGDGATINVSGGTFLVQGGNTSNTSGYSRGVNCGSGGNATFSGGASVVRAGAVGTGSTRYSSASHRTLFNKCNYTCDGMSSVKVGYTWLGTFSTGSNLSYTTGFACVPSSWKNLSDVSSGANGEITLSSDGYYINGTSKTSPATALPSLDTNGHTLFVVNLFEGSPNNWAAGLVLTDSGDVSFTGSGSVVAVGGLTTANPSFGMYAAGSLSVTGPTVIGVSGQGNAGSDGVSCVAGLLTVDSGKVIGVGSSPNSSSNESSGVNSQDLVASGTSYVAGVGGITSSTNTYGIKAQNVTAQDSASVLGVGGSASGEGANSYGISADSMVATAGTMAGVGGDRAAGSCGLDGGSIQVHRGARLSAVGGVQVTDCSYGISSLTDGVALQGSAVIAGTTSAIGLSGGMLQLDETGLAFGYTDFAGTADEATIDSGAALSSLSDYKHIKVDTQPYPLESGECGTCYWEITPEKVLMVYPGELAPAQDGAMPWIPNEDSTWGLSDIERVVMVSRGEAKVVAPSDSSYILSQLSYAQSMDLSGLDISQAQDLSCLFAGCSALESLNASMLDTSQATTMKSMFEDCSSLGTLSLSALDMSKVTDASDMFSGCTSLESLGFPAAGMANVVDASGMFEGCTAFESLDLSALDMVKVTDASNMFSGCASLAGLDLSAAGMVNVTDVSSMFSGCSSLASLDLSTVDMTKVTGTSNMFSGCTSLESLKLGSACKLASNMALTEAPTAHPYTGKWIRQEGGEPLTAVELASTYDGATMAGTYVWEQIVQRTPEELAQLIEMATTTSPYKDVGSVQVSADGTDVYTVDTWVTQEVKDALISALAAAQEVAANEEATQEQRDTAYYALEAAMASYVPQRGTKEKELVEVGTWSQLCEQLQDNGSIIRLTADVKYGTGGGEHESDALVVPAGFIASLDLNGHIVDRGLGQATEAVEGGSVIDVLGELTIKDSQPTAAHDPSFTFVDPLDAEHNITVTGGIITGGHAKTQLESISDWYFGGGGVLVENDARLAMTGGSICGNRSTGGEGSRNGGGGGVAVMPNGVLSMSGTAAVCGNYCEGDGGGLFISNAVLDMDGNASISFNNAPDGFGGGAFAFTCNVTMKGDSNVNGNKAHGFGGGLFFYYSSSLIMEDNVEVASNYTDYHGGGVAMYSFGATDMTITMKDKSRIHANSCNDDGGGVFLGNDEIVLNMFDESSISDNHANSEGGGVYANGGKLYLNGGEVSGNSSNGSGGGVCLGELNGGSELHMTGGTITGNSTHGSGGGVFAYSNARAFTIEGTVVIDGNEIVDDNGEHRADSNLHGAAGGDSSMAVPITVTGALGEGSAIGITQWGVPGEDSPVDAVSGFADNNPDADPLSIFTSDTNDYIVIVSAEGEPQLALPEGVGIWIGGKQVNVLNASDVFGDGTVSYDRATKTLTLNNYQFDGRGEMTHHAALATTVENLTVNVVGENKIVESGYYNWYDSTDCFGIWAANGLNITGSGTLETWAYYKNTNETTGAGIFLASGSLTIGESFTGELWAHANRGIGVLAAGDVLIQGGKVKFAGETRAVEASTVSLGKDLAVFGSGDAEAENGDVLALNGGENLLDITELAGEAYKSIWTEPFEYYDLWVNGERLSTVDLTVDCGDGTAVFDPDAETPTLTLTNATITNHLAGGAVDACVYSELPNLVVKTVGQNLIKPTESGVDGVGSADGCNIAVVSEADNPGSLKLEDVNYGFNIGGTIDVAGNLETISTAGGTNVPDSAITLAEGWSYTTGTSLTQSGNVVIEQVVTLTFDGNGHGDVLATMQVPKGKSANSAYNALSEEARAELEATAGGELTDGDKTYQVYDYSTSPDGSLGANWDAALYEDTTWYAQWVECVTLVEIAVEPPVCGTTTETSKNSQGNWEFDTQTNKPVGSVAGSNYVLPEGENGWFAAWCAGPAASIDADSDSLEPYVGEFTGGDSYTLLAYAQATGGCIFSKDVVVKVNGVECKTLASYDSISDRGYIGFVTEVTAAHNLKETPEVPATCTDGGFEAYWTCDPDQMGCGKTFSDAAGTQEISAPVPIEALGHLWGDWEIVTEATDEAEGLARRVCLRDPSHFEERVIPAGKNVEWKRLAGNTRYDTMAEIVKEGFEKSDWAVIATGANFPDALSASALAGFKNCPVVLTAQGSLSAQARAELVRLGVKNAYIMGGTVAISEKVEKQVKALNGGIKVTRIAGSNRMDTSVQVMNIVKGKSDTVIVATGYGYADALSIGPWSYAAKAPIVLTKSDGTLTAAEVKAIKSAGYKKYVIVGGTGVVKDSVKSQLSGLKFVGRLGGRNRYETSRLIVEFLLKNGLTAETPAVATGENFPDALAGAAMQGSTRSVILLVKNENSSSLKVITDNATTIQSGYVLGGTNAVPDSLVTHMQSLIVDVIATSTMSSSEVSLSAAHVAF